MSPPDPGAGYIPRDALLQRLVEHAPANLHFALAFRANPGLDLAMQVLDGSGIVMDADEFRFLPRRSNSSSRASCRPVN